MPRVLLLNPPSASGYLNRDLMSGLGVNIDTERNMVDGLITMLKSAGRRMPVMTMGYLNSILSKTAEVKVLDAGNTDMPADRVIEESVRFIPDFVFVASSISQLPFEIKILEAIKSRTGATVGFFGESADNFSKIIMRERNIDFLISGEPELVAPKIVDGLKQGYKVVCGWRAERKDPHSRLVLSYFFNFIDSVLFGIKIHDINCGFKGYDVDVLKRIEFRFQNFFIDTELLAYVYRVKLPITEVRIKHFPRENDMSKINAIKTSWDILVDCLKLKFL